MLLKILRELLRILMELIEIKEELQAIRKSLEYSPEEETHHFVKEINEETVKTERSPLIV